MSKKALVIQKDYLSKELWPEYYIHEYTCSNCLQRTFFWILKGVTIRKVENSFVCKVCECSYKQTLLEPR